MKANLAIFNYRAFLVLFAFMFALSGCAGFANPKTFEDKAYAASLSIDTIQQNAAMLVRAKKITPEDGENILKSADSAVAGIKLARTYRYTAPATADSKLTAAIIGLQALTDYLNKQGAK